MEQERQIHDTVIVSLQAALNLFGSVSRVNHEKIKRGKEAKGLISAQLRGDNRLGCVHSTVSRVTLFLIYSAVHQVVTN